MPRFTQAVTAASRDGKGNSRAYCLRSSERRYSHWKQQLAVYAAAARRQYNNRRPR